MLLSAEAAGIALASSCRNGTCRTCLCRLRAGQVAYDMEWPGLSAEEKSEGWILPCVALPRSDCVLEATPVSF
jgi:ferredoxin